MTKKYIPIPEEIPTGICECGCGLPTNIVKRQSVVKMRHFIGYPYPFRRGHSKNRKPPPRNDHLRGNKHPSWKGGRHLNKTLGYIYIYCPEHPEADKGGYYEEHRLVMERALGRYLGYNEIVHHINGVKTDNRIDNLSLTTKSEHATHHLKDARLHKFSPEHRQRLSAATKRYWKHGPMSLEERRRARAETVRRWYAKKRATSQ